MAGAEQERRRWRDAAWRRGVTIIPHTPWQEGAFTNKALRVDVSEPLPSRSISNATISSQYHMRRYRIVY